MRSALALVALMSALAAGARPQEPTDEPPYDARVTFVRLSYNMSADPTFGMRGDREPPWHHDYPRADRNLMHIIDEITSISAKTDGTRIIGIGDPDLCKYPIAYMSEPGFWTMTDKEAENLRNYVLKGGFIIFDDFAARHFANLATQWARMLPQTRWIKMDVSNPIFHSFFEIASLENLIPSYRGTPDFYGAFEDNDPKKRLLAIADYNNDIGESWEWAETGFMPVDETNESFKFGVNYYVYGLTH